MEIFSMSVCHQLVKLKIEHVIEENTTNFLSSQNMTTKEPTDYAKTIIVFEVHSENIINLCS